MTYCVWSSRGLLVAVVVGCWLAGSEPDPTAGWSLLTVSGSSTTVGGTGNQSQTTLLPTHLPTHTKDVFLR